MTIPKKSISGKWTSFGLPGQRLVSMVAKNKTAV
jgi:hypothetical protein